MRRRGPALTVLEQGSRNGVPHMGYGTMTTLSATQGVMSGGFPLQARGRRARPCPQCGARAGQGCQRQVGGVASGVPEAQRWWKPMKGYHAGR